MGLDIDKLLTLNRLRDTKINSTGVRRTIEICVNPDKVLKETENYTYRKVDVYDGAFVDEPGIIDEIVRMTFHNEEHYSSTKNYIRGKNEPNYGFYLRYKQMDNSHPFNLIFRKCEKAYMNKFKIDSGKKTAEEFFEEDHRSQARLLTFEILAGENKKFNESFRKQFNLDITSINDFKIILLDLVLAENVQKYITKTVSTEAHKIAFKGRNKDYVLGQKKVNGIKEKTTQQINTVYLDKNYSENEESDGYSFITIEDGVYADETTCVALTTEDEEELKEEENLYKYLLKNIDNILTKKQLLYLKAYLENDDESYLSTIAASTKSSNGMHVTRSYYKNNIITYIEKYLDKDLYTLRKNSKFEFKYSVLVALENILKKSSNKDIFIELCSYLSDAKYSNTILENILIDVLYNLEPAYYLPIVSYISSKSLDDRYIENEFICVIEALQSAYNWHGNNNIVIYNLNRNNKELVVEDKMKKILNNNKEGFVSRGKSDKYTSIRQLKEFLEGVENTKLTNKTLKEILNKYGYDINLSATKRNYIEVYSIFILGHEVKKKNTFKKKKRMFDLSIKQSKEIEKYIDNNLKLDRILRTNKNIDNNLKLCDIRNLLESMLEVKQLSVEEIYEVLLQCNYNLDLKCGSKQIDGIKVPAHKIKKLD